MGVAAVEWRWQWGIEGLLPDGPRHHPDTMCILVFHYPSSWDKTGVAGEGYTGPNEGRSFPLDWAYTEPPQSIDLPKLTEQWGRSRVERETWDLVRQYTDEAPRKCYFRLRSLAGYYKKALPKRGMTLRECDIELSRVPFECNACKNTTPAFGGTMRQSWHVHWPFGEGRDWEFCDKCLAKRNGFTECDIDLRQLDESGKMEHTSES